MKTLLRLAPIVLSACFILPGCEGSNSPDANVPTGAETKISDSDLQKAVRAKLESDDQLRQANLSVDAEAKDNKVSIKGTVTSQDIRTKAIELARSARPGLTINDEIEVRPAG